MGRIWTFELLCGAAGLGFGLAFAILVIPPLMVSGDVLGAFAAGFVNPYATGYSLDTITCAVVLILWVAHERARHGVRHGWVVLPLCFVPGVATAFAYYLILRRRTATIPPPSPAS